jgi:glutamate synthase domain-containing protein 3
MSGGIAYVRDEKAKFIDQVNTEMVELFSLAEQDSEEIGQVKALIEEHIKWTDSEMAKKIVADWDSEVKHFVKVISPAYRAVVEKKKEAVNG